MLKILQKIIILLMASVFFTTVFPQTAFVLNTLGENVSSVDLANRTVTANAFSAGLFTNQIVHHNGQGYIVNSGINQIQVVELPAGNTLQTYDMGAGTNPWAIEFIDATTAAVSLLFTNQVVFIDANNGSVLQQVTVGSGPEGMRYLNGKLYVANTGFSGSGYDPGMVSVIDVSDYSVSNIPVGLNPQSLDVDSNGNIVVACTGDFATVFGQIDVIDPASEMVIHSVNTNAIITYVDVSSTNKAFLSTFGFGVLVYDLTNQSFERDENNPLSGGPGLAFDSQDNIYIANFSTDTLSVYSPDYSLLDEFLVGDGPVSVAIYDLPNGIRGSNPQISESIALYGNYPNPFNPETHIRFETFGSQDVTLEIFDLAGRSVRTLVNGTIFGGLHSVRWDGKNTAGLGVAAGVYFYRLQAGKRVFMRKMHLVH